MKTVESRDELRVLLDTCKANNVKVKDVQVGLTYDSHTLMLDKLVHEVWFFNKEDEDLIDRLLR